MTFFLLFFFIIPLSQAQKKFDEQSINVVCQASKDDVILALQNLSLETIRLKKKFQWSRFGVFTIDYLKK